MSPRSSASTSSSKALFTTCSAIGTSCNSCSRLCAVTMMRSSVSASPASPAPASFLRDGLRDGAAPAVVRPVAPSTAARAAHQRAAQARAQDSSSSTSWRSPLPLGDGRSAPWRTPPVVVRHPESDPQLPSHRRDPFADQRDPFAWTTSRRRAPASSPRDRRCPCGRPGSIRRAARARSRIGGRRCPARPRPAACTGRGGAGPVVRVQP